MKILKDEELEENKINFSRYLLKKNEIEVLEKINEKKRPKSAAVSRINKVNPHQLALMQRM